MGRWIRYLRILWVVPMLISATLLAEPLPSSPVLIVEAQTGSSVSVSEEFIELANISDSDVNMSSWRVESFSASAADFTRPTRNITLHGILPPGDHYLLASTGYLTDIANDTFTGRAISETGGHIRLVSVNNTVSTTQDLLGWGTALHPFGMSVPKATDGQSLQRKIDSGSGEFINTNNNAADFETGTPSPQGYVPSPVVETPPVPAPSPEPAPDTGSQPGEITTPGVEPVIDNPALISPYITELLPNPAPPATDSNDEFIEIYNPNSSELNLTEYKLQSGSSFSYSFMFNGQTIPPLSYTVFNVADTKLVLANDSGKARLINPSGTVISETGAYEKAGDGQSWMWDGTLWQWSTTPTPGQANVLTLVAAKPPTAAAAKKAVTQKAAALKKSSTGKVKSASTKKSKKAAGDVAATNPPQTSAVVQPLHPAVLAGVGGLALLYAVYEYRHDMANFVYKLRRNRKLGLKNRPSA